MKPSRPGATGSSPGAPESASFSTYQLFILVSEPLRLQIGRLGLYDFPAGRYCYTGSAIGRLHQRVARHFIRNKQLRWHIDYLLAAAGVGIFDVRYSQLSECQLNQTSKGRVLIPGFGASDCRQGCVSHLKYLGQGVD